MLRSKSYHILNLNTQPTCHYRHHFHTGSKFSIQFFIHLPYIQVEVSKRDFNWRVVGKQMIVIRFWYQRLFLPLAPVFSVGKGSKKFIQNTNWHSIDEWGNDQAWLWCLSCFDEVRKKCQIILINSSHGTFSSTFLTFFDKNKG